MASLRVPERVVLRPQRRPGVYLDLRFDRDVETTRNMAQGSHPSLQLSLPGPWHFIPFDIHPPSLRRILVGLWGQEPGLPISTLDMERQASQPRAITSHDTAQSTESPSPPDAEPQTTVPDQMPSPIQQMFPGSIPQDKGTHVKQIQELHQVLEPLLGTEDGESCVLLMCHGKPLKCQVLPVVIPLSKVNADDKSVVWAAIREAWDMNHRNWRHRLPFYGVKRVSIASRINIVARQQSDDSGKSRRKLNQYIETFTQEDVEHLISQQKQIKQGAIDKMMQREDVDCMYDRETGQFIHSAECLNMRHCSPWAGCPFDDARCAEKRLLELEGRRLLTLAFEQPARARANDLLSPGFFYSHRDILEVCNKRWYPSLFELQFRGLIVDEGWLLSPQSVFILLLGTVFCFTVVSKFMFGGWGAAWGASACVVAFATLVHGLDYDKDFK